MACFFDDLNLSYTDFTPTEYGFIVLKSFISNPDMFPLKGRIAHVDFADYAYFFNAKILLLCG